MSSFTLQLAHPEPSRTLLATLVLQLALRQRELATLRHELQELQSRYLREIGGLQGQLFRLQRMVEDEEIRAGIRPPRVDEEPGDEPIPGDGPACAREAPSADLKRLFREIARMAHPDLAPDDAAKYRRHSIMAEANRAYAERNEDHLRLLMRTWPREPRSLILDADAEPDRVRQRFAETSLLLGQLELEAADLEASAIAKLKARIERTRVEGWDLFRGMISQVRNDIARETAKLIRLQRHATERATAPGNVTPGGRRT
jgi:hypothetical protein